MYDKTDHHRSEKVIALTGRDETPSGNKNTGKRISENMKENMKEHTNKSQTRNRQSLHKSTKLRTYYFPAKFR